MDNLFKTFAAPLDLLGRVLLALIFVAAGYGKIDGYEATVGYMNAMGVSGELLPLVIIVELVGGLAILLGLFTRPAAIALAGFSVLSGILFHSPADPAQQVMFLKNLSMAGGLLVVAAHGAGAWSLDAKFRKS